MLIQIILFIAIIIIVFGGMHYGLYSILVKFFDFSAPAKLRLAFILGFLGLNFITSMFLARAWDNTVSKALYMFGSVWIGILFNALLIMGCGLLLAGLISWRLYDLSYFWAGFILILITLSYSGCTAWNAYHIQSKYLDISIKDLPARWQGKKIVQITDIHLGMIHQRAGFEELIQKINDENPDLVLITGDLFDGEGDNINNLVQPIKKIKAPVYFVTGNHETYLGLDKAGSALSQVPVIILNDEIVDLDGLQLLGISFPERMKGKDLEPILKKLDQQKPAIMLYHEPAGIELAKKYGVDLQLAGHTHHGQLFPLRIFTYLFYKGKDAGLYREEDYHLYVSSGTGTWGPPMRSGNRPELVSITLNKK